MQRRSKKIIGTMSLFRDWRYSLHQPHMYRVIGNRNAFRNSNQFFIILIIIIMFLLSILIYILSPLTVNNSITESKKNINDMQCHGHNYDTTYPITPLNKTILGNTYKIAIISDLDKKSKSNNQENTWISILKKGRLLWSTKSNHISIDFDHDNIELPSKYSMKGRGMELSELVTFDGNLTTFDDRTGLVYHINNNKAYPWVILMDGNGRNEKGFKSEWATIKNNELYVGSMGKEWTTSDGVFVNNDPMWIKIISPCSEVRSVNWIDNYKKLRKAINIEFPGYMIHESGVWSHIHNRWFFLPRRCSHEQYNEIRDETMSCNVLLSADENFTNIKVITVQNPVPIRGFSSFKFLPGSQDTIIIALKTEEYLNQTATYITAFTINGTIILPDKKIAELKFEGFEFI